MKELNIQLLNYFGTFSNNPFIEKYIGILADTPIFFIPLFLLVSWLYYSFTQPLHTAQSYKERLLYIFYTTVLALIISLIIQQFVTIDRPEGYISQSSKLLMDHLPDASFPSDHATVSFAFVFALFFTHYTKIGFLFFPFVVIMNLSRVIAGVHWPFDIIAGMFVGLIANYIIFEHIKTSKIIQKVNAFIFKIMSFIKL